MPEVRIQDTAVLDDLVMQLQELREALQEYACDLRLWLERISEALAEELRSAQRAYEDRHYSSPEDDPSTLPRDDTSDGVSAENRAARLLEWVEGAEEACRRCALLQELLSHNAGLHQAAIDDRVFAGLAILHEAGSQLAEYVSAQLPPPLPTPPMPPSMEGRRGLDFTTGRQLPRATDEQCLRNPLRPFL